LEGRRVTHGKVYNLFSNGHVSRHQQASGHYTMLFIGVGLGWLLAMLVLG